jgi:hypothetical protein
VPSSAGPCARYGRKGGKIGGKRSLETMTPEERTARAKKASARRLRNGRLHGWRGNGRLSERRGPNALESEVHSRACKRECHTLGVKCRLDKGVVPLICGVTKQTSIPSSARRSETRMLLELFFPQSPASAPKRYAFAAACCAVLFASRLLLDPLLGETVPLLFFTLAVVVSAIRGGFGPGIFSTVLGVLFVVYFFPVRRQYLI